METATSARGGGLDHAQLVLTAEKLPSICSATLNARHTQVPGQALEDSEHNLASPSRSLYCIGVKG